ncbi:MAG: hypothetical protein ACTSWN_08330 [Promethearchaeota archaeon]
MSDPEKKYLLFSAVGSTPPAFANSVVWFLVQQRRKFPITDVYFIPTRNNEKKGIDGTATNIPKGIELIKESLSILAPDVDREVKIHAKPLFEIPEEDIIEASIICVREINKMMVADDVCIIDMTAGRKTMSAALSLTANILKYKFKKNVYLSYYWLLHWTKEYLSKKAHDLGIDDFEILIFDFDNLQKELKKTE